MTEEQLLKEYPLLNHEDFRLPKVSILKLMGQDKGKDLTDDRAFLTEFFDNKSEKNGDTFFWEMLRLLRFILEDTTAYTSPDGIISLNVPCDDMIPQDNDRFRRWYFVYCHECLHQLWDTFGVEKDIIKELGECNHTMLNVASDCVINDFLNKINNADKLLANGVITPEFLKENYNIDYDRNKDTQFTLYLKLLTLPKDKQQQLSKQQGQQGQGQGQQGQGQGQQGQGQGQGQQGNSGGSKDINQASDNLSGAADNCAKEAQKIADKLKENNDPNAKEAQEAANKAKDAANKAKEFSEKAKECAKKSDGKGAVDNLRKAIEETNKAKDALKEAQKLDGSNKGGDSKGGDSKGGDSEGGDSKGGDSKDGDSKDGKESELDKAIKDADNAANNANNSSNSSSDSKSSQGGKGASGGYSDEELEIIDSLKGEAEKIAKKYSDSITGPLAPFIKQCKLSKKLEKQGLALEAQNGSAHWDKTVLLEAKKYIRKKLQAQKKYQATYERIRRGERAFSSADMGRRVALQGRKQIRTKIGFDISLYVDKSGSMGDNMLEKVFKASYKIMDELKRQFGKDQIVDKDKISLTSYTFTTSMKKINYGEICRCGGGTYSFEDLLNDIHKQGLTSFLNIILTDGQFNGINESKVVDVLKDMEGLIILVTNQGEGYFDKLIQYTNPKAPNKLVAVYADSEWTLSK